MKLNRREWMLGAFACAGCAPIPRIASTSTVLRVSLIGQSLIRENICAQDWTGKRSVQTRLSNADVVFSDLETAIAGPRSGAPTRKPDTLHVAQPAVIDCLQSLGVSMLATSNNHSFDIGTGGILDAMAALEVRGMAFTGTGADIASATRPAIRSVPAGDVALVAAAAGFVREGGRATETRAGVNEIRRSESGVYNADDIARNLAAIRSAADGGAVVIAYLHNHYWEEPNWRTSDWQRDYARQCIDAGASLFVAHGAPLLHGIETYRGRPLLHGLGSFIFQTKKDQSAYGDWNWQSLIVDARFDRGAFMDATIVPVRTNAVGARGPADLATRGRPSIATGEDAAKILTRVAELSAIFGHDLAHDGEVGFIQASAVAQNSRG